MDFYDLWQASDEPMAVRLVAGLPWEVLSDLEAALIDLARSLPAEYEQIGLQIWAHPTARIAEDARLSAPCIIAEGAVVKPHAYLRGANYVGKGAVVGHAAELKNTVLLSHATVAHLNYVGDSVLGAYAHLGAGVILSNLRQDNAPVAVQIGGVRYPTTLRKLGALVGDFAEVGANAVLNPGTVLAAHGKVRPLRSVKGYIPAD